MRKMEVITARDTASLAATAGEAAAFLVSIHQE